MAETAPNPEEGKSNATSFLFQIVLIILTSIVLLITMYHAITEFRSADKMPELYSLTPSAAEKFSYASSKVTVGLQISSFPVFNFTTNTFSFIGVLWFEFDPSLISSKTIGNFSFEKGDIKHISAEHTKIIHGKMLSRYFVRVDFKNNVDYKFFPFASHSLYIAVDNHRVTPAEIIFTSSLPNFTISEGIFTPGWKEYDRHVYTGYSKIEELDKRYENPAILKHHEEKVSYRPRVIFGIDFLSTEVRQIITIILPLILIFFISMLSLAMDPKQYHTAVLSISSGGITALLAYRFVIQNLSPKVGYFMLSDWLFFLFLTSIFAIFFVNTETLVLSKRAKEYISILLHSIVIVTIIYLFNFWK